MLNIKLKRTLPVAFLLLLPGLLGAERTPLRKLWDARAAEANLVVSAVQDFEETTVNADAAALFPYQRAFKHVKLNLELRYSLVPRTAASRPAADNEKLSAKFNRLFKAPGKGIKVTAISPRNARREFGADGGVFIYAMNSAKTGFGKGYKMSIILALERADAPYLFVFLMIDDFSKMQESVFKSVFQSPRFRHESKKKAPRKKTRTR